MGIGTAAGHALAEQLMAAAALARAKGAELSHRMRTEAQEIRTAHQRANLWITQACFEKFARFASSKPKKCPLRAPSFCHISVTNRAASHVHMLFPPLFFSEFMQK